MRPGARPTCTRVKKGATSPPLLSETSKEAYHDGGMYAGQLYDDDQGGPLYVDGDEGVDLAPISTEQELEARRVAQQLFSRIEGR